MIRPILKFGDERLVQVSTRVDPEDLALLGHWIGDLRDSLGEVLAHNLRWTQAGLVPSSLAT